MAVTAELEKVAGEVLFAVQGAYFQDGCDEVETDTGEEIDRFWIVDGIFGETLRSYTVLVTDYFGETVGDPLDTPPGYPRSLYTVEHARDFVLNAVMLRLEEVEVSRSSTDAFVIDYPDDTHFLVTVSD
jgi:hypothetical protein